jgi:hypothetical protein
MRSLVLTAALSRECKNKRTWKRICFICLPKAASPATYLYVIQSVCIEIKKTNILKTRVSHIEHFTYRNRTATVRIYKSTSPFFGLTEMLMHLRYKRAPRWRQETRGEKDRKIRNEEASSSSNVLLISAYGVHLSCERAWTSLALSSPHPVRLLVRRNPFPK